MKLKKIITLFFIIGLLWSTVTFAAVKADETAAETRVEVIVNGEFIKLDVSPVFDQSHLLIPIRALATMGLTFQWNESSRTANIYNHLERSSLAVEQDNRIAVKDGESIEMTIPAQNRNGRILVPIRFVTEAFGYEVQYETVRKMVFINSPDYEFDPALIEQENLQAARKAAISLPITSDFEELGIPVLPYHGYAFVSGRADMYRFDDRYTISHVEIINGEAKLTAQYKTGPRSTIERKVGNIEYYGDPVMQQYYGPPFGNPVFFVNLGDGTSATSYYEGEDAYNFVTPLSIYSDIIQEIPGNR